MATFLLRLGDDEKDEWAERAKREGRSLNQQIIVTMRAAGDREGAGAATPSRRVAPGERPLRGPYTKQDSTR